MKCIRSIIYLLGMAYLTVQSAAAAEEYVKVADCTTPPVIDGVLNDKAWQNCVEISNFTNIRKTGVPAARDSKVYLTCDANNLYIALTAYEEFLDPVLNKLSEFKHACRTNDDLKIWRDDMFEFFLAPDSGNAKEYYHFAVNANGAFYDSLKQNNPAWNSGAKVAAATFASGPSAGKKYGWCAEIAIPWSAFKTAKPAINTLWKGNFCRSAPAIKEISSWCRTSGRFHAPETFGSIEFGKVSAVKNVSSLQSIKSGKNILSARFAAAGTIEIPGDFATDKTVFSNQGQGDVNVEFNCDFENKAYKATLGNAKDGTETFIRSTAIKLQDDHEYIFRAKVKSNFSWNQKNKPMSFFHLMPAKSKYIDLGIKVPCSTDGKWITLQNKFTYKSTLPATLWGIKWAKRNIRGELLIDDLEIIDCATGKNILNNGDFSAGSKNWNVFRKTTVPGYGAGASAFKLRYIFKDQDGNKLYSSPEYNFTLQPENLDLASNMVQFGYNGLIPIEKIKLAAGSIERFNLYLKSRLKSQISNVNISLRMPEDVRLSVPDSRTLYSALQQIKEKTVTVNDQKLREYTITVDAGSVNDPDVNFKLASGIPIMLTADSPRRGNIGVIEFKAEASKSLSEKNYHAIPLEILPPPVGIQPTVKLPLVLWVYPESTETFTMSDLQKRLLAEKIADAGFNLAMTRSVPMGRIFRQAGIRPFVMMQSLTIAGNYFPEAARFAAKHPEYAAVNAHGKKVAAVDPAVLTSENNPFLPYMEKVFKRYMEEFPEELHVDYEFCFMPKGKSTRPVGYAVTGYSQRNLELFRQKYNIKETTLTPEIIFGKYRDKWRDFRNGQNAEIMALYKKVAAKINPDVRFSLYSGFPPISGTHYGIDWKKVSPAVDLCMAGYGGNNELMFSEIKQNFFNSGLLQMGYSDSSLLSSVLTSLFCDAGSYLCYQHFTVDGEFFRQASEAAAIAAAAEKFLLDLRNSRKDNLTKSLKNSKNPCSFYTFSKEGDIAVVIINNSSDKQVCVLETEGVSAKDTAMQFSGKQLIKPEGNHYKVSIAPMSCDLIYFTNAANIKATAVPQVTASENLHYPIFRWQANNPALESYEVRFAAAEAALAAAPVKKVAEPWFQAPERKNIFIQARTVLPNGTKSQWSKAICGKTLQNTLADYKLDKTYGGSAGKININQFYAYGGGSPFCLGEVDKKDPAPGDTAALTITNEFDTANGYWTLHHRNGCSPVLPTVVPGKKYEFSAMMKTQGEIAGVLRIVALDAQGNVVAGKNASIAKSPKYRKRSAVLLMPEKARYMNVYFCNANGAGKVWASDFQLKVLP